MSDNLITSIENAEVISFDIFDTLFVRPLRDPEDLFDMVGEKFGIANFRLLRRDAQAQAFRRMQEQGKNEITLDGIYRCFPDLGIPVEKIREEEYRLELALTLPNPQMVRIFRELARDRRVAITSDMYLPLVFFEELFERNRLPAVPMFVSSDRDATKRDRGVLYDIVSETLGVLHRNILHIGDNLFSDIQQARAKGLKTFHYRNTRTPTPVNGAGPSASLASGLVRINEVEPEPDSFHRIGFLYGGPAAMGFLHWIQQQAAKDEIDYLLFVSRDGYILERLAGRYDVGLLPPYAYFKGSRVSFSMAATNEENFLDQIDFFVSGSHGLRPMEVLERIGVQAPAEQLLRDIGLGSDTRIDNESIPLLRAFLYAYRWEILKVCRQCRQGLLQYLLTTGIKPGMRVAMVDVGWSGTTQGAFEMALPGMMDIEVFGYYFCLRNDATCEHRRKTMRMKALVAPPSSTPELVARLYQNRVAVELLFSAPHHSVVGYRRLVDGEVEIVEDPGRSLRQNLKPIVEELIQGIDDFSACFDRVCRSAEYRPKPLDTVAPLLEFVDTLNNKTVALFSSVFNFDAWASSRNYNVALSDYIAPCPGTAAL